jgi:hypothetical protein
MVKKNSPLQHEHTSHQISNYLASCITHYVTNSNTYYNYNRNYPAVLKIRFAVSGKLKIWECYCSSNYYFPFWALALRRVAVKEVEILRQERKYRGIMMMVLFRIGLATFYIGFLLNISLALILAFLYISFPKEITPSIH